MQSHTKLRPVQVVSCITGEAKNEEKKKWEKNNKKKGETEKKLNNISYITKLLKRSAC
jgi:hypothetical protein